jgi:two-component system, OmpR family, response regulator
MPPKAPEDDEQSISANAPWNAWAVRVLVVEDEVGVATGVQRCLAADGFDVEIEHDGAAALARARSQPYDLIVLDIMLPSMNGYRVCTSLRADDNWTPILMLTAKCGEYDEAEALETGADDFLAKPFSMVVLQARARALLRRPARLREWPAVGDLRLDPVRRRCLRGDVVIELTAREIEVLAYLLEHADSTVGKDELLDAVWGSEFAGDRNVVEVYVGHLRRKIDEPFGRRSIQTVRGRGYLLRAEGN